MDLTSILAIGGITLGAGAAQYNGLDLATPISQKFRPITLVVSGSTTGFLPAWGHVFNPRPEEVNITNPTRATPIQTLGGAFLDDFGQGIADISLSGTTGWHGIAGVPGELVFVNLRNMLIEQFHAARQAAAEAGQDPSMIKMYYADTLNTVLYEVYPLSFQLRRSKSRPLMYQYSIRLAGLDKII